MRFLSLALAVLSLAAPALAGDCAANLQGGSCSANLQANYSNDVQQLQVQAYVAPVQQLRVVQRVVQPQAVYVQPQAQVVLRERSSAYVQNQVVTAPYVQQQLNVQSNYGVQQQLNVSSGYGSSQQLNLGSRQRLNGGAQLRLNLGGGQNSRTVTRSKTVTSTSSGGILGRLLGR